MSGVLVDTSVWVGHFRQSNAALVALLDADAVLGHPLVLGELCCGTPPARARTLADLALLQQARPAALPEVMSFIEREKLFGLGCGFVDISLLAATLITPGAQLWTQDKRLLALAERFGVMFRPTVQ